MNELLIGYARVSTSEQDLTAQRLALGKLGVDSDHIYVDHGLTGTNRERPGLRIALASCRTGDTLVVAKLDRLARSLRDASDIVDELTAKGVKLSIGGSVHDPKDPVGRLLSTFSLWSPSLNPTSSDPERARACRLRRPKGICEGSRRSCRLRNSVT